MAGSDDWRALRMGAARRALSVHLLTHGALDALPANALRTLSTDERERAAGFVFDRDRRQFQLSRLLLRLHLAEVLGCLPDEVGFRAGPSGKPRIARPASAEPVNFNLSHTHGAIVLAIAASEIGVDIENWRQQPFPLEVAETVFTRREREALAAAPPDDVGRLAYRLWTCKEAVIKGDGRGLGVDPRSIEFGHSICGAAADPQAWQCELEGRAWFGVTLAAKPDWLLSFAVTSASEQQSLLAAAADPIRWSISVEAMLCAAIGEPAGSS